MARQIRFVTTAASLALAVLTVASSVFAADADIVIDGFVKSTQDNKQLTDSQRKDVLGLVAKLRVDTDNRQTAITDALAEVNDDFLDALDALDDENTNKAIAGLQKLSGSSDVYLAAEASYFLGKAYVIEERYEDAVPVLKKLVGELTDQSMYLGEARYMLGSSYARLLNRKDASTRLETFLQKHPEAAERLRVGAARQLIELSELKDGTLPDVQDRMDYSRRKLALEKSGGRTREEQDRIVAMLDKLIEEAEQKEKSGGS